MRSLTKVSIGILCFGLTALLAPRPSRAATATGPTFRSDVDYLTNHTTVRVLQKGDAAVVICPELQGRVMTSSCAGMDGPSLGYMNRDNIANQGASQQFNNYGGEERLWIGPEGGQFSLFFPKARGFEFKDWVVPAPFNTDPWEITGSGSDFVVMREPMTLMNYSGTRFSVDIFRRISLLDASDLMANYALKLPEGVHCVGYLSENTLTNSGFTAIRRRTGLLSIWMLGMFNPSPETYVFIPLAPSPSSDPRDGITDTYFGKVPADRLKVTDSFLVFTADGQHRSKIGLNRSRARNVAASIDLKNNVLTVIRFDMPPDQDYVNSLWEIQDHPFAGDVVNSYNDGPVEPGGKSLGGFFELETSSPARELVPGESISHNQRVYHFQGPLEALDVVSRALTGISLPDVERVARGG